MRVNRLLIVISFPFFAYSQGDIYNDSTFLSYITAKSEFLREVIADTSKRVQICFTRFEQNDTQIQAKTYKYISDDYFFPASTVKLPVAILTMEKMARLGIGLDDILKIDDDVDCGNKEFVALTRRNDLTFRKIIEEMLVVSDNYYYNCLYHFLTPNEINTRLKELGFNQTNIYRSFSGCDVVNHLKTNGLKVINSDMEVVYSQPSKTMDLCDMSSCYILTEDKKLGIKHEYNNEILDGPYDFNYNLEIPIDELNLMMLKLVQPGLFDENSIWNLSESAREFLIYCCSKHPFELKNVKYKDRKKYPNTWFKFSYLSDAAMKSEGSRTISKLGLSYGFTTEVAYVLNREKQVQFQLSVSIYTNENRTVNDGKYEYEELARPFIATLTKILTEFEFSQESRFAHDVELERVVFDE